MFCRHPKDASKDSVEEYSQLLSAIERTLPIAPSQHPLRWFLANGSSVSLETGGSADLSTALIEIATPETCSPRELVCYQLANERILQGALQANRPVDQWSLIKSNSDAYGHTLGQHESYDMRIASGPMLLCWWIRLLGLLLPLLLYRVLASLWLGGMLLLSIAIGALQGFRGTKESEKKPFRPTAEHRDLIRPQPCPLAMDAGCIGTQAASSASRLALRLAFECNGFAPPPQESKCFLRFSMPARRGRASGRRVSVLGIS